MQNLWWHGARVISVVLFLALPDVAHADSDGILCTGETAYACLNLLDKEPIIASSGRWFGSSVEFGVHSRPKEDQAFVSLGVQVGEQWSFKRGFGDTYGRVPLIIALRRTMWLNEFLWGDQYQTLTTGAARDLRAVGFSYMGGGTEFFTLPVEHAKLGDHDLTHTGHAKESYFGVGIALRFHKFVIPDPVYKLPFDQFNREIQLRLLEQRPIVESDTSEFVFKFSPSMHLVLDFGGAVIENHVELLSAAGGNLRAETARGAQEVRLSIVRPWFEIGLAGRGQTALLKGAPLFLLPSIGGHFAMRSVHQGEFADLHTGAIAAFAGPTFLRAFVERGWSGGAASGVASLWGGGVALAFAQLIGLVDDSELDDRAPGTLWRWIQANSPEVVVGVNQKEGVVLTGSIGGLLDTGF